MYITFHAKDDPKKIDPPELTGENSMNVSDILPSLPIRLFVNASRV